MSSIRFVRRDLAWLTALLVIVTSVWVVGGDRADAGVAPPGDGIDVVYIAVATNFPDSLGVGPGAGAFNAPILIVPTDPPLPATTAGELVRLDPKKVVIVGGTAVVSQAMQNELEDLLTNAAFERIAGANRYETNAMFSEATFPIEGWASVSAPAFSEFSDNREYSIGTSSFDVNDGTMHASIQLPHGAEIVELKGIANDTSSSDLTVTLGRASESSTEQIAQTSSSGTLGETSFSTTTINVGTEVVDNENWAYWISASLTAPDKQINAVMVRYRLGASG